jgi:diphthine-ammonia ligase
MNIGSLFSGGKDSAFAIYKVQNQGHNVACLLSVFPKSDESHLLHHPNMKWTELQSKSMKIPYLFTSSGSNDVDEELSALEILLQKAKNQFDIEGVVHGGIQSNFQKNKFETLCSKLNLMPFTPLWGIDSRQYMDDLLDSGFDFMMTTVSSGGLDDSWLGKLISKSDIDVLEDLSKKFGFNLNFEGGEAETFVDHRNVNLHTDRAHMRSFLTIKNTLANNSCFCRTVFTWLGRVIFHNSTWLTTRLIGVRQQNIGAYFQGTKIRRFTHEKWFLLEYLTFTQVNKIEKDRFTDKILSKCFFHNRNSKCI